MCDQLVRVTLTGTYGAGRAPYSGCIGLHLILYIIHSTATYRRWAMSHSNTPPVRRYVSANEHHTAEQDSKIVMDKNESISQGGIYHGILARTSWRVFHDTLTSCSGNRAKVLLKSHLGIKCHSQYMKVIGLFQHSSADVNGADRGRLFSKILKIYGCVKKSYILKIIGNSGFFFQCTNYIH